jgi:hypothetical protein
LTGDPFTLLDCFESVNTLFLDLILTVLRVLTVLYWTGDPLTLSEVDTTPVAAAQGMIFTENASDITIESCALKASGISAFWLQEASSSITVKNNWVEDIAGFGLYANGIEYGDRRYPSAAEAYVNYGHRIIGNVFLDGGRQIEYGTGVWFYQSGDATITHNVISRFPRDAVGFYGGWPMWTSEPDGTVAPRNQPKNMGANSTRRYWGRFATWDGGNVTWNGTTEQSYSTWDLILNKNIYLAFNEMS